MASAAARPAHHQPSRAQLTQGMPFFAVTAPPCGPRVGMTADPGDGLLDPLLAGLMCGTVALAPSMISTWAAPTDAPGAGLTPNSAAIWPAFTRAAAPGP